MYILGYLPYVEVNQRYVQQQLQLYLQGKNPTDQWQEEQDSTQQCSYEFTELGKKLMGIVPW